MDALVAVAPLVTRWMERLLAGHAPPLTVVQHLALNVIARDHVAATELARRTGVSGPAVSQLVAGLADAGLVERRADERDRRRHELALTASGRRVLASSGSLLSERLAFLRSDLERPEEDALLRLLGRVAGTLSGSPPPRRAAPPRPPRPPR